MRRPRPAALNGEVATFVSPSLHAGRFRLIVEAMADHRSADIRTLPSSGMDRRKNNPERSDAGMQRQDQPHGTYRGRLTVSDYRVSEKQRQISTQTSLLDATWMNKKFNIMDTPGYLDFMSEALAALHVADFAVAMIHAQHGIGVGTERVSNFADECGIAKIIVINAMDKQNANFDQVLSDARAHYGPRAHRSAIRA